ncbi:hypothetical protein B0H14DRAFT_2894551 [Mycena olivaceomarginata]|nr:hypothetical protein B0H14DRAFT_2894551 [Mycena olivaceomarginata]
MFSKHTNFRRQLAGIVRCVDRDELSKIPDFNPSNHQVCFSHHLNIIQIASTRDGPRDDDDVFFDVTWTYSILSSAFRMSKSLLTKPAKCLNVIFHGTVKPVVSDFETEKYCFMIDSGSRVPDVVLHTVDPKTPADFAADLSDTDVVAILTNLEVEFNEVVKTITTNRRDIAKSLVFIPAAEDCLSFSSKPGITWYNGWARKTPAGTVMGWTIGDAVDSTVEYE